MRRNEAMQRSLRILLLVTVVLTLAGEAQQVATESFVWRQGRQIIGRLTVPKGFRLEVYDYREGTVTTLRYKNGAYIVLQVGGMYRIPLFDGREYNLLSSTERDNRTVRTGRAANAELYWREDDYHHKRIGGERFSWLALWPPNVGYAKVAREQRPEFDRALDSFIREVDRDGGPAPGR